LQIGTKSNKNIGRLIQALEGINCKLIIVGFLSNKYIDLLYEKNIDFDSYYNLSEKELILLYQKSDIISFPSISEGFGLPILEGQATGRAVLTSNISSMPEIAGEGALLVDPYSIDEIRAGFLKLISDTAFREDLIKKGFENLKRYEASTIKKQYFELYKKVYNSHQD
jgi:glycosyltransferase involved in cell wall biosynthesis